jgi:IrrE N-terminal-like domain
VGNESNTLKGQDMNDQEMMDVINGFAEAAANHFPCYHGTETKLYATGQPPAGWKDKAARFARKLGYELRYTMEPAYLNGPGTNGFTSGYAPRGQCPGCGGFHDDDHDHVIAVRPDLSPAKQYSVTCHELAHAYLRHPAQDEHEYIREMQKAYRQGGTREDFSHETSAQLAAVAAVSASATLTPHYSLICYLADRVHGHRRPIGDAERRAAFLAGRAIAEALA